MLKKLGPIAESLGTIDTTSVNGEARDVKNIEAVSLQINVSNSSTPDMYFILQFSNDDVTYDTVPGSQIDLTADNSHYIDYDPCNWLYIRPRVVYTSGDADVDLVWAFKELL